MTTINRYRGATISLLSAGVAGFAFMWGIQPAQADENGISYWIPGSYGSLAATPQVPGWAMAIIHIHADVGASGAVGASRQATIGRFNPNVSVNLNVNLDARVDMAVLMPSYVFAEPVFGGQLAVSLGTAVGRSNVGLDGTLTASVGGLTTTRQGSIDSSVTGFGDLYPKAELRWNSGVHNFMTYLTGDIPVGAYDSTRLANLGIGHGAIDGGAGYTYFDPTKGHEFSAVAGFTYNFKNPDTNYRSGTNFHIDLAAAQFLSKQLFIGAVGYHYNQITDDDGALPIFNGFRSRVSAVGPQIGYLFPIGGMQGVLHLKGYWEFDVANRTEGWNTWLTFAISPAAPPSK